MVYNFLKKNGIPDEQIITGLSEFHACSPYNYYPGKLLLTEQTHVLESCHSDISIDYKESDFHNFAFIDILKGRHGNLLNNFSKMKTDRNSRIVIVITSHGGENFIKVRGRSVVLSDELNRALNEMHIKGRYKEILFILDTCEGESLFDYVDIPNVYFITSSKRDQKAHSYSFDYKQMTPTSDRFHFKFLEKLENYYKKRAFTSSLHDFFLDIHRQREFIDSDVIIKNKISRPIAFEDFFGNYQKKSGRSLKYNYALDFDKLTEEKVKIDSFFKHNKAILDKVISVDKEVLNIKSYEEETYMYDQIYVNKSQNSLLLQDLNFISPIKLAFFFVLVYLIINLNK